MNMKLEESTTEQVSPLLQEIVQGVLAHNKCTDSSQKELLFVLIIVLMIENGYSPIKSDGEVIEDSKTIASEHIIRWRSAAGLMEATFVLNGFTTIPLKLIVSPLGATAILNLVIIDFNSETYTVCLPVSRYVVSPQASSIPMIFRDLKHFSVTVKNKILSPVRSRILHYCGYPSASLMGLPEEVFYKIMMDLPVVADIVHISITCQRLKYLVENEVLWKDLCKRDFPNAPSDQSDWKTLYREKFVESLENRVRERSRGAGAMHDYMDYADYMSHIDNPMWENMII